MWIIQDCLPGPATVLFSESLRQKWNLLSTPSPLPFYCECHIQPVRQLQESVHARAAFSSWQRETFDARQQSRKWGTEGGRQKREEDRPLSFLKQLLYPLLLFPIKRCQKASFRRHTAGPQGPATRAAADRHLVYTSLICHSGNRVTRTRHPALASLGRTGESRMLLWRHLCHECQTAWKRAGLQPIITPNQGNSHPPTLAH